MILLFFTRLALYYLAVLIPIIHPAIVVPYDVSGWWLWFFLVPGEMGIAYFLRPPRFNRKVQLYTALVFLVITTLGVAGISPGSLTFLLAGSVAFVLTLLVFQGGELGGLISFVEPVFLGFVYYRLLSFSRSSESISAESAGATQLVFALIIVTYLVHGLVLYFSAFRGREKKRRRIEVLVLGAVAVPLVFLFTIVLPGDFVDHSVVLNNLYPDKEPETIYDTDTAKGWEERRNGITDPRRGSAGQGEDAENGREGVLQGIPSDQWGSFSSGQGGEEKQYAVMLVISPKDPVYAADAYFPELDPVRGFLPVGDGALNTLTTQRFIETWTNFDVPEGDTMRLPTNVAYISTLR